MLRTHRKCGIATNLMRQAHARMQESFGAVYCSLHVRYTNMAAFHLYSQTLGYKIADIEKAYYADGEDAYSMKCEFEAPKSKVVLKKKVSKKKVTSSAAVTSSSSNGSASSSSSASNVVNTMMDELSVNETMDDLVSSTADMTMGDRGIEPQDTTAATSISNNSNNSNNKTTTDAGGEEEEEG